MTITPDAASKLAEAYTAAWNTGHPEAVAGFFADVPDLVLVCDKMRCAGDHMAFLWTFTGTHSETGKPLNIQGWEEWDIGPDHKVTASRGWFDAQEYARQVAGE